MHSFMKRARAATKIPTIFPSVRDLLAACGTINVGVNITCNQVVPRAPIAYERSVEYAIKYMLSKNRYTWHITVNFCSHITLLVCMTLLQWCGGIVPVHVANHCVMQTCVWAK